MFYVTIADEEYAAHVASAEEVENSLIGNTQGNEACAFHLAYFLLQLLLCKVIIRMASVDVVS